MNQPSEPRKGWEFSKLALEAAREARRRKAEIPVVKGLPELFVVRNPPTDLLFGWEIRRFGGVLLDRSTTDYPSQQAARSAGETVLARHGARP